MPVQSNFLGTFFYMMMMLSFFILFVGILHEANTFRFAILKYVKIFPNNNKYRKFLISHIKKYHERQKLQSPSQSCFRECY